jgi:hypothetical protein
MYCLCSPLYTELCKHVFDVRFHCLGRNAQYPRNFLVGLTLADECENGPFAWAQHGRESRHRAHLFRAFDAAAQHIAVRRNSHRLLESTRGMVHREARGGGQGFEPNALIRMSLDKFAYPALDAWGQSSAELRICHFPENVIRLANA